MIWLAPWNQIWLRYCQSSILSLDVTLRKVGTKGKAVKEGIKNSYNLLYTFGKDKISIQMIADAEKFIVNCITSHNVDTFNELPYLVYHKKHLKFDIERFPPTSASVRQHILRAYLQCYIWLHAPFIADIQLNPLDYGYTLDENGNLVPVLTTKPSISDELPAPCNCLKCGQIQEKKDRQAYFRLWVWHNWHPIDARVTTLDKDGYIEILGYSTEFSKYES